MSSLLRVLRIVGFGAFVCCAVAAAITFVFHVIELLVGFMIPTDVRGVATIFLTVVITGLTFPVYLHYWE